MLPSVFSAKNTMKRGLPHWNLVSVGGWRYRPHFTSCFVTQNMSEREMLKNRENREGFIFPCWQLITLSLIQGSCFSGCCHGDQTWVSSLLNAASMDWHCKAGSGFHPHFRCSKAARLLSCNRCVFNFTLHEKPKIPEIKWPTNEPNICRIFIILKGLKQFGVFTRRV